MHVFSKDIVQEAGRVLHRLQNYFGRLANGSVNPPGGVTASEAVSATRSAPEIAPHGSLRLP